MNFRKKPTPEETAKLVAEQKRTRLEMQAFKRWQQQVGRKLPSYGDKDARTRRDVYRYFDSLGTPELQSAMRAMKNYLAGKTVKGYKPLLKNRKPEAG